MLKLREEQLTLWGFAGSKTWVGLGIWVHNLRRVAQMIK